MSKLIPVIWNYDFQTLIGHADINHEGNVIVTITDPRLIEEVLQNQKKFLHGISVKPEPAKPKEKVMEISERMLKAYCDNARAYGYEIGRGQTLAPVVQSSEGNPFVHPDWDKDLPNPKGFMLTAVENTL